MHRPILGKKQHENNSRFQSVYENIEDYVSRSHLDNLIDKTIFDIKAHINGKRVGYGWSAGKDSAVLKFLMDQCNVELCVMGMTTDLEYPEVLRWTTDNMPRGLTIFNSGHSLEWLSQPENLHMLFPKTTIIAANWFKNIQHKAQREFFRKNNLDLICLGRRKKDSNHVGKGSNIYTNREGITRYSPISEWSHEETLACIHYYDLPLSPFYKWVNGWVVGTGCWPARQWTGSIYEGWRQTYSIDPSIVVNAAKKIDSAKLFLQRK